MGQETPPVLFGYAFVLRTHLYLYDDDAAAAAPTVFLNTLSSKTFFNLQFCFQPIDHVSAFFPRREV